MKNDDCKTVITLRNEKKYEGPKLLICEESDATNEPTLEENARNEKELEKLKKIVVKKKVREFFQSLTIFHSYSKT